MLPLVKITGGAIDALLLYGSILAVLLIIAVWLRLKISILKKLFIPASLIAGLLGLLLAQFRVLPSEVIQCWSTLPGRLITVVFAPMLMGISIPRLKDLTKGVGPMVLQCYISTFFQYALPLILGIILFSPLWGINNFFSLIVEVGWAGGHGTAGGMADVYKQFNFADGGDLALTSATFGLMFGIIGGMALINYGVRKGYTAIIKSPDQVKHIRNDVLLEKDRTPGSINTMNKDVIEPFAFHAGLIGIAIILGWLLQEGLKASLNFSLPLFTTSMICGFIVQIVISKTNWATLVDKRTFQRIQGMALEFLVVSAVASISIPVVMKYALPLILQQVVMAIFMIWNFVWLGRRLYRANWFENSIAVFGAWTGVVPIGLMLLRAVDPDLETDATQNFALRGIFTSPMIGGGMLTALAPTFLSSYGPLKMAAASLGLGLLCLVLVKIFGWWNHPLKNQVSA